MGCYRWNKMGGTCWADPGVQLVHHGDLMFPIPDMIAKDREIAELKSKLMAYEQPEPLREVVA